MPFLTSVEVALQSNATAAFAAAASGLMAANTQRRGIEEGIKEWNKPLLALGFFFSSWAIIKEFESIAGAAKEVLNVQNQLEQLGVTSEQVTKLKAKFYDEIQRTIPTAGLAQYLKQIGELRAITGPDAEGLAKAEFMAVKALMTNELLANLTGGKEGIISRRDSEYWKLLRSEELKGIATTDAEREKFTDQLYALTAAFHGKITASEFLNAAKTAGSAWKHLTLEALGPVAVLIADLGSGEKAGRALKTLEQVQTGAGMQYSGSQVAILSAAGLLKEGAVASGNEISLEQALTADAIKEAKVNVRAGGIKGSIEYQGNIPGWINDVVSPAIHKLAEKMAKEGKAGGNVETIHEDLMTRLFRHRNAQRLALMFSDKGMRDQIAKDVGLAAAVKAIDLGYQYMLKNNPVAAEKGYLAARKNMWAAIGSPMMKTAIPIMQALTVVFRGVGQFANNHPDILKGLAAGLMASAAALTTAAFALIGSVLGPGGLIVGLIMGLGLVSVVLAPAVLRHLRDGFRWLKNLNAAFIFAKAAQLRDALIEGIKAGLSDLWEQIKAFVIGMFSTPTPPGGNYNLNPYPGVAGQIPAAWHPGSDPGDVIQVNHTTSMKDGAIVARNTQLFHEAAYIGPSDGFDLDGNAGTGWPERDPKSPDWKGHEPPPWAGKEGQGPTDRIPPDFQGGYKPYTEPEVDQSGNDPHDEKNPHITDHEGGQPKYQEPEGGDPEDKDSGDEQPGAQGGSHQSKGGGQGERPGTERGHDAAGEPGSPGTQSGPGRERPQKQDQPKPKQQQQAHHDHKETGPAKAEAKPETKPEQKASHEAKAPPKEAPPPKEAKQETKGAPTADAPRQGMTGTPSGAAAEKPAHAAKQETRPEGKGDLPRQGAAGTPGGPAADHQSRPPRPREGLKGGPSGAAADRPAKKSNDPAHRYPEGGTARQKTAQAMANELRRNGYSENAIAGIMANAEHESNLKPGLQERSPNAKARQMGGGGYGLYQFTGSKPGTEGRKYRDWMKQNYPGKPLNDPTLQTRYLAQKGIDAKTKARLNASRSGGEAAQHFLRGYEKPAEQHARRRGAQYARGVPSVESYTGRGQPGAGTPNSAQSGTTGVQQSSAAGRGQVTQAHLSQAHQALTSGQAKNYMARQGYHNRGEAWCGEFAASVVKSSGGRPPANAPVASNWLRYGKHVDAKDARPGDVAVRTRSRFGGPARPGQTGSHVGFVYSVDKDRKGFQMLGGNQGRPITGRRMGQWEFRRGE